MITRDTLDMTARIQEQTRTVLDDLQRLRVVLHAARAQAADPRPTDGRRDRDAAVLVQTAHALRDLANGQESLQAAAARDLADWLVERADQIRTGLVTIKDPTP